MSNLMGMLTTIQSYVWGPPTLLLLIGTGLYFTIKLRGLQITKFPRAVRAIFEKESGTGSGEGDVSAFATLCTTMAADIGTGSIVGVATALRIGGPGSLFWMWISAILGMVTKYSESLLAVKYRVTDENNQMAGGPFTIIYRAQRMINFLPAPMQKPFLCLAYVQHYLAAERFRR